MRARSYAAKAHEGQKYGEEFPYFTHVWAAYTVAVRFGITDPVILQAILLHDVLEDTDRDWEEVSAFFGLEVAEIVATVTEPQGLPRHERQRVTYPKIAVHWKAKIVKLCDRISHVEFGGKKVAMYRKEHAYFRSALGGPLTAIEADMWQYLENLLVTV
jgi:GTP pyrophosphokinase